MADEGEANLAEERNQIKQLQSDIARKREQLDRLKQRKVAFDDELKERSGELNAIKEEHKFAQKKAQKASQYGTTQKTVEAETHFMSDEVKRFLQERIPSMAPPEEEPDNDVDQGVADVDATVEDPGKNLHDTVLISYVNFAGDKKEEDFKVSYRIDHSITVAELLKDACNYWGCSRHDYTLCKIENDEPKDLADHMNDFLQKEHILSPQEHSHLHLVRKLDMDQFKAAQERRQKDRKGEGEEVVADEGKKLMTLKHGLGNVTAEQVTEPFVEALKPWPGVYKLLKKRHRKHDTQKWLRSRLADFIIYAIMIIFSVSCFFCRTELEKYLLRYGVHQALVEGLPGQTTTGVSIDMRDVQTVAMAQQYLSGCFDYQLFNPDSALRKFYTPVGDLRFRVQKAKTRTCQRPDVPASLQRDCRYVEAADSSQAQTEMLEFPVSQLPLLEQLTAGSSGDPTLWKTSTVATDDIWGKISHMYSSSGYQFWFPINPANLSDITTKMGDLASRPVWLTSDTRFLAAEFTLANYHAGGYVSCSVVLEIAPSGAAVMQAVLLPFHLANTGGDNTADVLDIFRWIIFVGYFCLYKVWRACEDYTMEGQSGLRYVLSLAGLLDASTVALFFALQYTVLNLQKPGEPMSSSNSQEFVAYSRWASREEMRLIGEAVLVFLFTVRYTMLLRFYPGVYRFFILFFKSFRGGMYYLFIFLPVVLSTIFFANTLYSPYVEGYSTWVRSLMSIVSALQNVVNIDDLYNASPAWTFVFTLYCYLILFCFFVNGFLAITAYAYFEVELLEHSDPKYERWSRDQWLDWALAGPIYRRISGKEPGSSRKIGAAEDEEDGDDEGSSDEED
ncbi:unnamed protein product [Effrenium voratum]|uniref:Polycystin cation channel PKD1/PKD2 domain-containing protein n=1 Tax=Effrenium voratum TaxID=2562239 RepID=A0AA36MGL3_9DINO|nr:unnamed protein product [Effrenium voratum]